MPATAYRFSISSRVSGGGAVPAVSVRAIAMKPRWADQSLYTSRMTNWDGLFGVNPPLEGAVGGDVELAVVERRLTVGHVVVGVLATEHLEGQIGGGAATAGDDVLVAGLHAGAEVHACRGCPAPSS